MEGNTSTTSQELFYDSLIASYVDSPRFVPRDWLWQRVRSALDQPSCRFVLLTAEPGAGKSSFMASVARNHPNWPRYFIRRDQRTPLEDGGARGFLEKTGFQLAARHPEAFQTDAIRISVSQAVGSSGGQVTGAEVDRLIGSPFYSKTIAILQEVKDNQGSVTGIRVRELVTDPNRISLSDLQRMALLAPALALQTQGHAEPIVVLIDALDELRYRPLGDTVLEWLTQCPELPANVRILVTSRPDPEWLAAFRSAQQAHLLEETIPQIGDDVRKDLAEYSGKLVAMPKVESFLVAHKRPEQPAQEAKDQFVASALEKSRGNLGYLDAVGRAIDQALASNDQALLEGLLELRQLPDTLQDLYGHFLKLLRGSVGDINVVFEDPVSHVQGLVNAWTNVYRPALGVLAVAMEPLTPAQIRRLGRMLAGEDDVSEAIGRLRQFLDEQGARFTFYHSTVPEFLVSQATREAPEYRELAVDPAIWHERIVASYRGQAASWDQVDWRAVDDYGLRHLPQHLSLTGNAQGLSGVLLDYGWLQTKLNRIGIRTLIADYDLALLQAVLPRSDRDSLSLVQKALRLSSHILAAEQNQLAGQLTGRLLTSDNPSVQTLLQQIREQADRPWLRPFSSSLLPATSPIEFVLGAHAYPVRAVAVTPDGEHAISAADDKTLKVWNIETGENLRTLAGHTDAILAVAVGPDGRLAVTGSQDRTLRIWDLETGVQQRSIEAHDAPVSAVAITPDGLHIVSGSYDTTLKMWDLKTGAYCRTLHGHTEGVNALALTPDGSRLVSGSYDCTLKLWDLPSGQAVHTFRGHQAQVTAVAISPDGRWVISASDDRTLKLWDLESKSELHTFSGHDDVVTSVAISPDGRIISGSKDTTLRVWDLASRELIGVLEGHSFWVWGVAITPDGRRAISASGDTTLNVWNLDARIAPQPHPGRAGFLTAIAVTPDGCFAVSSARDEAGQIFRVWDLRSGLEIHAAHGYLNYAQDGLQMVSAGYVEPLQVRDLNTGAGTVLPLSGWMDRKTLFLPDGQPLEVRDLRTPIVCLAVPGASEGVRTFAGHKSVVYDVAVTPDGKRLITTSDDRTLGIWELDTGQNLAFLSGHTREVWSIAVARDGHTAVSSSDDRNVIVWDLERQLPIARFSADGALTACAISPDGKTVITGDEAGRMHILRLEEIE